MLVIMIYAALLFCVGLIILLLALSITLAILRFFYEVILIIKDKLNKGK